MEFTTVVVFVGLVLLWAVRRLTWQGSRALVLSSEQPGGLPVSSDYNLYVSIPILRLVELDPMLWIVVRGSRHEVYLLPTRGGSGIPLPEAVLSKRVWAKLDAKARENQGVEFNA